MSLIAKSKTSGKRLDITQIPNPRVTLKANDCVCQLCNAPVILKAGLIKQHHFAHKSLCTSTYESHPESPAHLAGKRFLSENLRSFFQEYQQTTIEFEVPIPEVKRIADLLVTFPQGWRIAHEVQLASITVENLQKRTDDYALAGIDVVWWLGNNANTPANRKWCEDTFGYVLCINHTDRETNLLQSPNHPPAP